MNDFKYDKSIHKYFGEYAHFSDEVEKEEAKKYLELWKKFFMRRLKKDSFSCTIVDEQWGERDAMYNGCLNSDSTLYLKICLQANWNYELD